MSIVNIANLIGYELKAEKHYAISFKWCYSDDDDFLHLLKESFPGEIYPAEVPAVGSYLVFKNPMNEA